MKITSVTKLTPYQRAKQLRNRLEKRGIENPKVIQVNGRTFVVWGK